MRIPILAALFLLAALCTAPHSAQAAQSYDNCTGFIDSVPAVIATQGTWCLRKDLSTAQTSGTAIDIQTNNVTIDCNDFKLGGLSAGASSTTYGIGTTDEERNVTIRRCNIRGFLYGIQLSGDGYLIEDNRADNNLFGGIRAVGGQGLVRRNRVFDTGGASGEADALGIYVTDADVVDNIVDGIHTDLPTRHVIGISVQDGGYQRIERNRIGGLRLDGDGMTYGIRAVGGENNHFVIKGNRVSAASPIASGAGIYAGDDLQSVCAGNTVANFAMAYAQCQLVGASNDNL